jgi:hypothetical protein
MVRLNAIFDSVLRATGVRNPKSKVCFKNYDKKAKSLNFAQQ